MNQKSAPGVNADIEEPARHYNVLVFGLDRLKRAIPENPIKHRHFTIHFEHFTTDRRFPEYDLVLVFQGAFEDFEHVRGGYQPYHNHHYYKDDFDRRSKELATLLRNGGVIAIILTSPFADMVSGSDYRHSDLSKKLLNYPDFYRKNFDERIPHVNITRTGNELLRFFDVYGAASTYFENYNRELDLVSFATVGDRIVSFRIGGNRYFIPALLPPSNTEESAEYFTLLVDGLTAIENKSHGEIPEWVQSFRFNEEEAIAAEKRSLESRLAELQAQSDQLSEFKSALIYSGTELVKVIAELIRHASNLTCDLTDDFHEDAKLMDEDGTIVAVCEIKGINRGVKRENINQTDSHRERSDFSPDFPALLIANTNIKQARTIAEKDEEIHIDQARFAAKNKILVLRTLDLLNLLRLVRASEISQSDVRNFFLTTHGWLRVVGDEISIVGQDT